MIISASIDVVRYFLMNQLLPMRCLLLIAAMMMVAGLSAQENPNYDPDFDDNGCYTVLDILSFLVILMPDDAGMVADNPNYDPDFDGNGELTIMDLTGMLTWFGTCEPELQCVSPTMDGHTYDVVPIGGQCWFAENLRTTEYADGTPIPETTSAADWQTNALVMGVQSIYGSYAPCSGEYPNFDPCSGSEGLGVFGRLYSLYAVQDSRGVCPTGWHVPTGLEWVGLRDQTANVEELMAVGAWPGPATNTTGFGAVPGGQHSSGGFSEAGEFGIWWCSDQYSEGNPNNDTQTFFQLPAGAVSGLPIDPVALGHSIRCVQSED